MRDTPTRRPLYDTAAVALLVVVAVAVVVAAPMTAAAAETAVAPRLPIPNTLLMNDWLSDLLRSG
jgi:hypothetical protein